MTISFDITTVADEQLDGLAPLFPAEVAAEKVRRSAYPSFPEALAALAQVAVDLETVFSQIRASTAAKSIEGTGVLKVIERTLNLAKSQSIEFAAPEVRAIEVPKQTRAPRKAKEVVEGEEAPKKGKKDKGEQVEAERVV